MDYAFIMNVVSNFDDVPEVSIALARITEARAIHPVCLKKQSETFHTGCIQRYIDAGPS